MPANRWDCFRKVRHETREAADAALAGAARMRVYRCPMCDGYHVGHLTRRKRFRIGAGAVRQPAAPGRGGR